MSSLNITSLNEFRARRQEAKQMEDVDNRAPDLTIQVWADDKGEILNTQLLGANSLPVDKTTDRLNIAYMSVLASRQAAGILTEMGYNQLDDPDAWKTEPVLHACILRGGIAASHSTYFWEFESFQGIRGRLSAVHWVIRQLGLITRPLFGLCFRLIFNPKSFRKE